eukprot:3326202-Prymnesium_polylepis.1
MAVRAAAACACPIETLHRVKIRRGPPVQVARAATVPVRPRSPALNRLLQLAALPTALRAAAVDA